VTEKSFLFSEKDLSDYERLYRRHDPLVRARRLIVDYAREQGGLTLEVWKLMKGPWFGEPQMMTREAVAETLAVPLSDVARVLQETHAEVSPKMRELGPDLARVRSEVKAEYRRERESR
jgi:hypothetical protein